MHIQYQCTCDGLSSLHYIDRAGVYNNNTCVFAGMGM